MDMEQAAASAALRRKSPTSTTISASTAGDAYVAGFSLEVTAAIERGKGIEPIKHHRAATGLGLAEAKVEIDMLLDQRKQLGL